MQKENTLLDRGERRDAVVADVDEPLDHHLLRLSCPVRSADRLKLRGRVPRRSRDVDARRLLQVQAHSTRLDLDEEDCPRRPSLEVGDRFVSPLLCDRPIDAKHWYFQVGQHLLDVVHFSHELREDERLLLGVLENIRDEGRHLPGTPRGPQFRTFVLLDGHAVQVQLRPRHHLTHAQERLEKHHLPTGSRTHLDHLADHILPATEGLFVERLFLREHLELDVLKLTRREREACVEFGHALLGAPEDIRVSHLVGVALDHIPWDAHEAAERHKVLDGVEDGRA